MAETVSKCQICGQVKPLTREHLPQRGLYPKSVRPLIENLNTVAACADCNNSSSVVDELLKVCFGLIADAPWVQELRDSVDSTLSKNQRLARLLEDNSRVEAYETKGGTSVEVRVLKLPRDVTEPLVGAVERIIKALFYRHFGKVLVEHYEVSVFHPGGIHPELSKRMYGALDQAQRYSLNNNTVHYCFAVMNATDIVWVINIYGNIEFFFVLKELGWRERSQ